MPSGGGIHPINSQWKSTAAKSPLLDCPAKQFRPQPPIELVIKLDHEYRGHLASWLGKNVSANLGAIQFNSSICAIRRRGPCGAGFTIVHFSKRRLWATTWEATPTWCCLCRILGGGQVMRARSVCLRMLLLKVSAYTEFL